MSSVILLEFKELGEALLGVVELLKAASLFQLLLHHIFYWLEFLLKALNEADCDLILGYDSCDYHSLHIN